MQPHAGQLLGQRPRQAFDRPLRRAVRPHVRGGRSSPARADVDEDAGAAFELMHAFALGLNSLFFPGEPWAGYLSEAVLVILIAAGAGAFAYRSFEEAGPPVPTEAINEAQKTKALLTTGEEEEEQG